MLIPECATIDDPRLAYFPSSIFAAAVLLATKFLHASGAYDENRLISSRRSHGIQYPFAIKTASRGPRLQLAIVTISHKRRMRSLVAREVQEPRSGTSLSVLRWATDYCSRKRIFTRGADKIAHREKRLSARWNRDASRHSIGEIALVDDRTRKFENDANS